LKLLRLRTAWRARLAVLSWLSVSSCAVKELPPREPTPGNVAGARQFRVECIEPDECKERALAACGSPYEVVSEWHNTIPESELPGLNEESRPKDARDWNRYRLPDRTGIESNEPMPLTTLIVACTR
jgi:hypothetical protein